MPPTLTMALWKPTSRRFPWSLRGSMNASSCTVVVKPLQPLYTARFVKVLRGESQERRTKSNLETVLRRVHHKKENDVKVSERNN